MKKIDLGQSIGILANAGVILGIVFLVAELQQNNELMEAQARFNRLSIVNDAWRSLAENGDLTELRVRAGNNEVLSEAEQRRVDAAVMRVFVNLDWIFRELPDDSAELYNAREVQRNNFANDASYRKVWEVRKSTFDPQFVQWIEENVVN